MLRGITSKRIGRWLMVATLLLGAEGTLFAAPGGRNGDLVKGKIQAPGLEDHANYFAENRKDVSAADQEKADKLRRKTIDSIKDLLDSKKKSVRRFELLLRLGELYVERHDYLRDVELSKYEKA